MPNPVMYLVANKGLGMSPGKLAAQTAHAAVRAYLTSGLAIRSEWLKLGETKIVLEARDTEHLLSVREYIEKRGYRTYLIIDEGRTEIAPHSPTVLGIEILDKDDPNVKFTFSSLKTYKEDKPKNEEISDRPRGFIRTVVRRKRQR